MDVVTQFYVLFRQATKEMEPSGTEWNRDRPSSPYKYHRKDKVLQL